MANLLSRPNLMAAAIWLCVSALWGCASVDGRPASDEYYQRVPGAVAWSKRHVHETEHYRIESNCSTDSVKRYGRTLEMLYTQWSKYIGKPEFRQKLKVHVYATREGFQQALDKSDTVRGVYGNGTAITHRGIWRGSSARDSLFHEGTHQLHDACMGIEKAPIWFAEGLARFFEHFRSDAEGNLYPAFDDDGLRRTPWDMYRPLGMLPPLLSTPKEKFDVDCYDQAHLLIYFLVSTTKENRNIFESYWRTLLRREEEPGSALFIRLLGGMKALLAFEQRWRKWVFSLHYRDIPEEARQKAVEAANENPE